MEVRDASWGLSGKSGGVGTRKKSPPMPAMDEERVRVAIDSWERPSEMMDGLAWMIALVVRRAADGESLDVGDGLADEMGSESADGEETVPDAREDWFMALVERDRLAGWKRAAVAHVQTERLLAAIFGDEEGRRWAREMDRELDGWKELDEIPEPVARLFAQHLAAGREPVAWEALVRQAPEVAAALEGGRRERDGVWPAWLSRVATKDPVLGIKVAAEAAMRVGMRGTKG